MIQPKSNGRSQTATSPAKRSNVGGDSLDFALLYASLGYRVLPVRRAGKEPLTKHGVHDATSCEVAIRQRPTLWSNSNSAIATGGGLLVLDIDPRHGGNDSLIALEAEFGTIPRTCVVNTGGGGQHIYLSCPKHRKIKTRHGWRPGLDIQGEGSYVVAPPSIHPSGACYSWATAIPTAGPALCPKSLLDALTDDLTNGDMGQNSSISPILSHRDAKPWTADTQKRILAVVNHKTVRLAGTRNRKQLRLAQALSNIPECKNRPVRDFEPVLWLWYEKSKDQMKMDWAGAWSHFQYLWETWVDRGYRDEAQQAFDAAISKPFPLAANRYRSLTMQRLVATCAELHATRASRGRGWCLSVRKAADILGIGRQQANRYLNKLVFDKVLEKTEDRKQGSLRAQRYRYIADDRTEAEAA
jgi:hypothetical protein